MSGYVSNCMQRTYIESHAVQSAVVQSWQMFDLEIKKTKICIISTFETESVAFLSLHGKCLHLYGICAHLLAN